MKTPQTRSSSGSLNLYLLDGTKSSKSYAAVARRGHVLLGIAFSGLIDGTKLGLPGKTYLCVRVRSTRDQALANEIDMANGSKNVVGLFDQPDSVDAAWPNFAFEKIDRKRASLVVGLFIGASLDEDVVAVVGRIEEGKLLRKLVDYVIERAGPENCIAPADLISAWLSDQVKPTLEDLQAAIAHQKAAQATQKEFEAAIEGQLEVPGSYGQQLKAIYDKHQCAGAAGSLELGD